MRNSATSFNTKVTTIADKIQSARMQFKKENHCLNISDSDTRKAIIYCLLYLLFGFNNATTLLEVLQKLGFSRCGDIKNPVITRTCVQDTLNILLQIKEDHDWKSILSYACEALEYDANDYFLVDINRGVRSTIPKKKNKGIYYTPKDVIDFMVSRCLGSLLGRTKYPKIIDCSCGSGLFLINCLFYLESIYNKDHSLNTSLNLLNQCIWGVDISPIAIDCCKMTFAQYYLEYYKETVDTFEQIWQTICDSLFVGDSTKFQLILEQNDSLPRKFDCIIGNPPYVTKGNSSNLFIPFVNNVMQYTSEVSSSSLILPLSICYAKGAGYTTLREQIQIDSAKWEFLNYDRSPDSLFGDQVKTRNTILFRDATQKHAIYTTKLQRWVSERRDSLFKNIELCDITDIDISTTIPKISDEETKAVYKKLCVDVGCLLDLLQYQGTGENFLIVNGTAYNWLCAYDHIPPSTDEDGTPYISGSAKKYYTADEKEQYFCLALISNRIAYWYWMATGDGFHLNTSFFADCHMRRNDFSNEQYNRLCQLGKEYSTIVRQHPTVSYNAGKTIINYSHSAAMDTVANIEKILISALNLPDGLQARLASWYENQVRCNRD